MLALIPKCLRPQQPLQHHQPLHQVEQWLSETEWNYGDELSHQAFAKVVSELLELGLITQKESEKWEEKLF